jgi:phosphoribosyl 1,2-cyclic phosphate phosphodiesterase
MQATLTFLGCGTSMGVPTVGCECTVCRSTDPRDNRTRPSVLVSYPDGGNTRNILIDTSYDFRQQALRERIMHLDAVLYTHAHADHIMGLDDVRSLSFRHADDKDERLPLFASAGTAASIRQTFHYIFDENSTYRTLPRVKLLDLNDGVDLFGVRFECFKVIHGETEVDAIRFGSAAYVTDFSSIPPASMDHLRNLDVLVLDALRENPHPTHSSLSNSLKIVEELKPKRAFFTHMSHDLGYETTNAKLPSHIRLAYDGLKLEFEI